MKNRFTYSLGTGLSIAAVCTTAYFLSPTNEEQNLNLERSTQEIATFENKSSDEHTSPVIIEIPGIQKTEKGFQLSEEMKERLQTVSEAYEERIKFPDFSLPIKAEELDSKYLPDIPIANETPARLKDPASPVLSIKPNQFRFSQGEQLTVIASITGLVDGDSSSVMSKLLLDGEVIAHAGVNSMSEQEHVYEIDFGELFLDDISWKQELVIETEFMFDGKVYSRGTSIEYVSTMAAIEEISPAEVEAEYLNIPVYISTQKPGYHRVRGNLYDLSSGEPLLHLRAEGDLDSNAATLTLKAHIAALKEAGSEGPYELRDLSLQRLPSKPDYITEFGKVDQQTYHIDGFSFSEYLDKPYINEKSQRIAKELRRMGT